MDILIGGLSIFGLALLYNKNNKKENGAFDIYPENIPKGALVINNDLVDKNIKGDIDIILLASGDCSGESKVLKEILKLNKDINIKTIYIVDILYMHSSNLSEAIKNIHDNINNNVNIESFNSYYDLSKDMVINFDKYKNVKFILSIQFQQSPNINIHNYDTIRKKLTQFNTTQKILLSAEQINELTSIIRYYKYFYYPLTTIFSEVDKNVKWYNFFIDDPNNNHLLVDKNHNKTMNDIINQFSNKKNICDLLNKEQWIKLYYLFDLIYNSIDNNIEGEIIDNEKEYKDKEEYDLYKKIVKNIIKLECIN